MAMRNDEFNKKIIENVKNRIVVSNLESEEHMKINNINRGNGNYYGNR